MPSPPNASAPSRVVDVGETALVEGDRPYVVHQAHALGDRAARAAQVDGLAAGPQCGRPFDDGGVEAALA